MTGSQEPARRRTLRAVGLVLALVVLAGGATVAIVYLIETRNEARQARIAVAEVTAETSGPGRPANAKKPRDRIYRLRTADTIRITTLVPAEALASMTHVGVLIRNIDKTILVGLAPLPADGQQALLVPELGAMVARAEGGITLVIPAEKMPASDYDIRTVVAPGAFDEPMLRALAGGERAPEQVDTMTVVYVSRSVGVRVRDEVDAVLQTDSPPPDAPQPPAPSGPRQR